MLITSSSVVIEIIAKSFVIATEITKWNSKDQFSELKQGIYQIVVTQLQKFGIKSYIGHDDGQMGINRRRGPYY